MTNPLFARREQVPGPRRPRAPQLPTAPQPAEPVVSRLATPMSDVSPREPAPPSFVDAQLRNRPGAAGILRSISESKSADNPTLANQEVNYLLQRIESYTGICILTTNHETALDEAFRRRLSVHVRFPMPEADERARLWQALLPSTAPTTGSLALDRLAETFVMSGGHIRNAVLRAAFLAADDGAPIDGAHMLRAARLEYEAMGKIVSALAKPLTSSAGKDTHHVG